MKGSSWHFRLARSFAVTLVLGLWAPGLPGATIPVSLSGDGPMPPVIAVNVGDQVVWTAAAGQSGTVEAFGGTWQSPVLTNGGAGFAHTFTNAGFFAYRAGPGLGTINVVPWTNAPPAISIYNPIDGFYLPGATPGFATNLALIEASLNTTAQVDHVDFLVEDSATNVTVLGTVMAPPYQVVVPTPWRGTVWLSARLTTRDGAVVVSPAVRVTFGVELLFGPRRLPGGEFLCYWSWFSPVEPISGFHVYALASLPSRNYQHLTTLPTSWGIFLDSSATNASQRFYVIGSGQ